jgi:hypothetical protein
MITDRILEAFSLIWDSGVWTHKPNEIIKILLYAHSKGWLYLITKNEKVVGLWISYLVEKFEDIDKHYPLKEGGRVLFVPIVVMKPGEKMYCMRRIRGWYRNNKQNFDEIVYEKNDRLIRKRVRDGKEQGSPVTGRADVPKQSECQLQY